MSAPNESLSARGAPGVHLGIPTLDEAKTIVRSIVRVLLDSNRTSDIGVAEEVSSRAQLRFLLEHRVKASPEGRALLEARPELNTTDVAALRALPDGTLGRELVRYLDLHGLDFHFDDCLPPYLTDPDESYLLRRIRRNHDIWHVLLGLGPEGHEEVLVHAFTLTQVGLPSSVAIVSLGAVKHMVLERRWTTLRDTLPAAMELGRATPPLFLVRWEELWSEPVEEVRRRFGLPALESRAA